MFELTEEQWQALDRRQEFPPRARDPHTNETYVLIHAEMYERVRGILEEEEEIAAVRDMYPLVSEALDQDEAGDPSSRESA